MSTTFVTEEMDVALEFTVTGYKGEKPTGALVIPSSVTEIGYGAFSGCTGLTSVVIPEGVTRIGEHAFRDCTGLTSIEIPSSVTSIGVQAFDGCTGLTFFVVADENPDYTAINGLLCSKDGGKLVTCPKGLTSVVIPEGVTSIGWLAFDGCSSLTSITIPKGVTKIGDGAFSGCSSLTSVTIPEGVTLIRKGAFVACTAIKEMIFKGPPPHVEPLNDEDKYYLECEGFSNPETLPATKGYYLPEHAEAWEKVLGGETGKWNNLKMKPISLR